MLKSALQNLHLSDCVLEVVATFNLHRAQNVCIFHIGTRTIEIIEWPIAQEVLNRLLEDSDQALPVKQAGHRLTDITHIWTYNFIQFLFLFFKHIYIFLNIHRYILFLLCTVYTSLHRVRSFAFNTWFDCIGALAYMIYVLYCVDEFVCSCVLAGLQSFPLNADLDQCGLML